MRLLDKYAIKEMVVPTLAGMLVIIIMMLGNFLFYHIHELFHRADFIDIVKLLLLTIPSSAWMILPSGALFGCALAVTRLARDSEITMMRMAGISARRIFLPIFIVGILLSGVHYLVQEKVAPWAETKSKDIINRILCMPGAPSIQENVFFNSENYWFYVQRVEKKGNKSILHKVMVYELDPGDEYPEITTAETAVQEGNIWILKNGISRKTGNDGFIRYEEKFDEGKLDLRSSISSLWNNQKSAEEMTASELGKHIQIMQSSNSPVTSNWKTNYYFKLSIPLSCFLIMLCAAPLALKYGRTGGFTGILMGILVLALYWNVIVFGKLLGSVAILPPAVAGWSEVVIFMVAGAILLWKAE
ncbi:MAG: LptF/LptG family permease [Armatimonadota bacterium]